MKHSHQIPLKVLQALWISISLIYILFYLASIQPMILSFIDDANQLYSNALPRIGLTPEGFAVFFTIVNLMLPGAAWSVAAVIFWKRRNDRMALLVSAGLVMFSSTLGRAAIAFTLAHYDLFWLVTILRVVAGISIVIILSTFPDGKFVPRWSFGIVVLALAVSPYAGDSRNYIQPNATTPAAAISITWFIMGLGFQVYRYRKHSSPVERQQTKWILYGMSIAILSLGALLVLNVFLAQLPAEAQLTRLITRIVANTFLLFVPASFVPIAIGIAIMRNRLWDIDLIIHRSLAVFVVTISLATLFLAVVLIARAVLQQTLAGLPFILATIIAGAMFDPTRRSVQRFLDRRFYRWRFDMIQLTAAEHDKSKARFGTWTGRNVDGYEVESIIGTGGMGEVYLAIKNNRSYAIKTILDNAPTEDILRFRRESSILAQLNHDNIIHFVNSRLIPPPYIALEYIDGINLRTLLTQRGRLTPNDALLILRGLAEGLDYAHARGIVHCDVKPTNVLLRLARDGETVAPLLIDFGLAHNPSDTTITGTGAIGSIAYMAPEQIETAQVVSPKTDIYALGVVLYEMVTGQTPFSGNPGQVLFAHLSQPVPDAREIVPDLPCSFSDAIRRAMAKDAKDRWKSAGAMIAALSEETIAA